VAAVETRNLHAAADALNLTQSAVTKRIKALETRAGTSLLERGHFGVRPTTAGRLLYPEAKQALAALQRAEAVLAEHRDRTGQQLALAASHTVGEFLLPDWLSGFRAAHPGVRAGVDIVNSTGVLKAVRANDAQIGFVEGLDALDDFETLPLREDEIVAVVAAGHRWAKRRSLVAATLKTEPYFTREAGSGTRAVAAAALQNAGVELTPALESASTQSVKRALVTGGFALLSRLVIEAETQRGTLVAIPVRDAELRRELQAVRNGPLTGAGRDFWAWLRAHAQRGPTLM
jgi:DNA-binding transcriptional LysR family regulator